MKTIKITEEQAKMLRKLVYEAIDEKNFNKFASGQVNNVVKHLSDKAKAGDASLIQRANDNGINVDSLKGELSHNDYTKNVDAQVQKLLDAKNEEIGGWVKTYLPVLRQCYDGMNFQTSKDQVTQRRDANGNLIVKDTAKTYFDKLDGNTRSEVLKVREFLDKEGLTFIYRECNKPKTVINRYGIITNDCDWTTPIEDIDMDFSNITDSEVREYYGGTRIIWINQKLKELGYDIKSDTKAISADDDAWTGANGREGGRDIAIASKREMVARRYVQRKYGMEFNFGQNNNMLSYGNAKINDDTLIINFTAASRCPAWNECLLKDACYARTTEAHYDNTLNRNLRTNLIWEQTQEDPELMELMRRLICACLIDYRSLASFVNKMRPKEYTGALFEANKGPKVTADELVKMKISEIRDKYGDEALDFMKSKRYGNIVRLNEDGDFIGQWLVDAWDEWAGDLKLVGINVVAYTCRALNYEKVSNMILNLSQENLVHGQNAKAIAHYFYAVEPKTYNALGETYINPAATSEEDRYSLNINPSLNEGKIQQVGTPTDIYNEPVNSFVADFIGDSNILDGTMLCDRKVKFIDEEFDCVDEGFGENTPVEVVVRPEDVNIKKDIQKGLFCGTITSCTFKGVYYQVFLNTDKGYELMAHDYRKFEVGDLVGINILPENIQVMKKERTCNAFDAIVLDSNHLEMLDGVFECLPTEIAPGTKVRAEVDFDKIDLMDHQDEGSAAGQVYSIIYKGNHYHLTILTDKRKHIFVNTNDVWDKRDLVGIRIEPKDIKIVKVNED